MDKKDLIKMFESSKLEVYSYFKQVANDGFFDEERHQVNKTKWREKNSENSFSFEDDCIKNIFNIKSDFFHDKYKQVTDKNKYEKKRIKTLHSSALLCLLCFYGVDNDNLLKMRLNNRNVFFHRSSFEVKNYFYKGHNPSNIDVKLEGYYEDDKERIVVLYLESKFSEYLTLGKYQGISKEVYKDIYEEIECNIGNSWDLQFSYEGDTISMGEKGNNNHYCGGIKQMISHYMGVNNIDSSDDIYLGEIVFDFENKVDTARKKLEDYNELYGSLSSALNKMTDKRQNVFILPKLLTYQKVFSITENPEYKLDHDVKSLYRL